MAKAYKLQIRTPKGNLVDIQNEIGPLLAEMVKEVDQTLDLSEPRRVKRILLKMDQFREDVLKNMSFTDHTLEELANYHEGVASRPGKNMRRVSPGKLVGSRAAYSRLNSPNTGPHPDYQIHIQSFGEDGDDEERLVENASNAHSLFKAIKVKNYRYKRQVTITLQVREDKEQLMTWLELGTTKMRPRPVLQHAWAIAERDIENEIKYILDYAFTDVRVT